MIVDKSPLHSSTLRLAYTSTVPSSATKPVMVALLLLATSLCAQVRVVIPKRQFQPEERIPAKLENLTSHRITVCVQFGCGLNKDYNHDLKGLFKGAATRASVQPGPFQEFYQRSLAKGIKPPMVRLTLARKIAAITLTLWKKGEDFDINKLNTQAA